MCSSDIIGISEHGLYDCQLWKLNQVNSDFNVVSRACNSLKDDDCNNKLGHSGVALFWRDTLSQYVTPLNDIKSDRMCAIDVMIPNKRRTIVVSVYLPHKTSQVANYTSELETLEMLVDRAQAADSGIIILGDINAHFGSELSPRCLGVTSPNGVQFQTFVERNNLHFADLTAAASGPMYTFQSKVHGGRSYIDHCVVSDDLVHDIKQCWVYDDCIENTSDHLPVGMKIYHAVNQTEPVPSEVGAGFIPWRKLSVEDINVTYTFPLDVAMAPMLNAYNESVRRDMVDKDMLEAFAEDIKHTILGTAARLVQTRRRGSHLKPYWNNQLTMLSRREKHVWREWVSAGRPRDHDSPEWLSYKEAKRDFRRERRKVESQYHMKQIDDLCRKAEMDQKGFWFIVNKVRKPRQSRIRPTRGESGNMLTDSQEIAEDWGQYYENIFRKAGSGQGYNDQFYDEVVSALPDMKQESFDRPNNVTRHRITEHEVRRVCETLKNGKAPGWDGVSNEHLKYMGPTAIEAITTLFNSMIQVEHIPLCFKQGIIVPVPKGGGKDATKKENNRPITLLPCIYKVFEKILLNRLDEWLVSEGRMNEMQGAFQKGFSSTDVVALLNETIAYHTGQGETAYVVLLDVAKAFDSVWSDGLLYKLFNLGLEGRLWRLLQKSYDGFKCEVLVNKTKSSMFLLERGVHQGAPLSMRLYQLFNNDLLHSLSESGYSAGIVELKTGTPGYADDIALIALYKKCMNILLSTAYKHSRQWRYDFNARKSLALCFGQDEAKGQNLRLGGEKVQLIDSTCHMGVPLCPNKQQLKRELGKRCEKVKREVRVMASMGSHFAPLPPSVGSKLYKSVCLPKLVYGLEACVVDDDSVNDLEQTSRYCAKKIQCLPPQTANPVPTATLGWWPVEGVINLAKMVLLYRWLTMPRMNIFKQTAIMRLAQYMYGNGVSANISPLLDSYRLFVKYGIEHLIHDVLEKGSRLPLTTLKRTLRTAVEDQSWTKWETSRLMYPSLNLFRLCFETIELCIWWRVSLDLPHMTRSTINIVKLMCGQHCLASNPGHGTGASKLCGLCDSYEVESVSHFLFSCNALDEVRGPSWDSLLVHLPEPMASALNNMNHVDKTIFLLSGFKVNFTPEWLGLYEATALHINKLYMERCKIKPHDI